MFHSMRSKMILAMLVVTGCAVVLVTAMFYQRSAGMIEADRLVSDLISGLRSQRGKLPACDRSQRILLGVHRHDRYLRFSQILPDTQSRDSARCKYGRGNSVHRN